VISRRTSISLGEVYESYFSLYAPNPLFISGKLTVEKDRLYDFCYENNYDSWFCNEIKGLRNRKREIKELLMGLHTGETQYRVTGSWTQDKRKKLGQKYLRKLAEDMLNFYNNRMDAHSREEIEECIKQLLLNLELDGYIFHNNKLLTSETDILEIKEEIGLLETLYDALHLDNKDLSLHHLQLSEEHYVTKKWDDCISNSRKFLENVLREVASAYSQKCKKVIFEKSLYESPFKVRDYLEEEGLLDKKEKEAIAKIYGLLSDTGSHPYMASNDQARLLRQLALTLSQFVMLRFEGYLKKQT
jgi:hypothetical protein